MIPFWSLNDKLEDGELEQQIQRMHEVGIDGFFLHARGGLKTEYMSDDWFDRMETCIKKAEELGMQAWLYDENGWPSGFADGIVPAKGESFQQKALQYTVLKDSDTLPENLIALYRVADGCVTRIAERESGAAAVYYTVNKYYVDTLNREATESFIDNVHERYYARLKPYFDGRIQGFFTDEPQYAAWGSVPWSPGMCKVWGERYGGDMVDGLPLLFVEAEGAAQFRYRFFSLASDLIVHNYLEPIFNWCEAHNCKLTGHMMLEDTLTSQIQAIGAAMPCYEYFQHPGIDHLTRCIRDPLLPKQLSSAAAQFGRPTITETFAGCGWDVSLNELKWIAQWQYVNGVTDLCQHLQGYTLRGLRKRDWPASLFIQQPWFDEAYGQFNRYFTRLGEVLRSGENAADVLLLHPIKSAYMVYNPKDTNSPAHVLDRNFRAQLQNLSDSHVLYHLGDEDLMRRHGEVTADGKMRVGHCVYRTVVLPEMISITESTYRLLMDFAAAGGKIYSIGTRPTCIDALPDTRMDTLLQKVEAVDITALKEKVGTVAVLENGAVCTELHYNARLLENGRMAVYFANLKDTPRTTRIALNGAVQVTVCDLLSDRRTVADTEYQNGKTVFAFDFAKYGDLLIETQPCATPQKAASCRTVKLPLSQQAALAAMSDNALTLDYCEYRIGDGEWQPSKYVLKLQDECIRLGHACDIQLRYTFEVADLAGVRSMDVAIECPEEYTIAINGRPYTFADKGYYIDKSFRRSDIHAFLKEGQNEVVLSGRFAQKEQVYELYNTPNVHESVWNKLTLDSEIESIYIVGQFGTATEKTPTFGRRRTVFGGAHYTVGALPETVDVRDLTEQGLWFFSGAATLRNSVKLHKEEGTRYVVSLRDLHAPSAKVRVNGRDVAILNFAPFCADVTDYVVDGDNTVDIVLFSGNRNALGPHHAQCGEYHIVSPDMFRSDTSSRMDEGRLVGWTDEYNFVTFGYEV